MSEPLAAGFPVRAKRSKFLFVSVAAGLPALTFGFTSDYSMLRLFDLNLELQFSRTSCKTQA